MGPVARLLAEDRSALAATRPSPCPRLRSETDRAEGARMGHHTGSSGRGLGREAQTAVFSAGISGTFPKVPTDPSQLAAAARKTLPEEAFAYIAGGAGAERTVAANRKAFARWQIWPRVLQDVSARDLRSEERRVGKECRSRGWRQDWRSRRTEQERRR